MTYKDACTAACPERCGKGVERLGDPGHFYHHEKVKHGTGLASCTAPTIEAWAESESARTEAIERRWLLTIKHGWRIVQYGPHFVVLPIEGDSVGDGLTAEAAVDDAIERKDKA